MTGIIGSLTIRHIKENKKRTIVTILGIMASTALITAILVGIYSFFSFFGDIAVITEGNWHASVEKIDDESLSRLEADDRIEEIGRLNTDYSLSGIQLDNDKQLRFRTANITQADAAYFDMFISAEYEGELPTNSSEIAVEEEFLKNNGLNLAVGDCLEFRLGNRYTVDPDGTVVYMAGDYNSSEGFETLSEENLKITAILHGNPATKSFAVIRGMAADEKPLVTDAYIKLHKLNRSTTTLVGKIMSDAGISKYALNNELLISSFAVKDMGRSVKSMFAMMTVALAIVMGTSVILIYNAFGMSLAEKIRYLGMLASVGATKKQKRASVYFEGFILGLVGVPLGIFFGIIGSYVTLSLLGTRIIESNMIVGLEGMKGSVPLRVSPVILLTVILLSTITIFISAVVPAVKASKAMPVEALRGNGTIKIRKKAKHGTFLTKRIFGFEGELAYKNIMRNGRKGSIIIASIAVSVTMFLAVTYFCDTFQTANYYDFNIPYQVSATCTYKDQARLRDEVMALDGVKEINTAEMISYYFEPLADFPSYIPPNPEICNPEFLTKEYSHLFETCKGMWLIVVDDAEFKELLSKNGLNEADYFGDELNGVVLNNFYHEKTRKKVFNESMIGSRLFYDDPELNPPAVTVKGFVDWDKDNYYFKLSPKGSISMYVPFSMFYGKQLEMRGEDDVLCTIGIICDNHEEIYEKVFDMLEYDGYQHYTCTDAESAMAAMNTVLLTLKTAIYGFTALITLIVIANIVNTISTGVMLRRKEFAMFKSIGMTEQGLKKMLSLETFLYGFRALAIGIPASIALSFLMYKALANITIPFEINVPIYILTILAVMGVIALSMFMSSSKLKGDNIIDVLKNDIC